MSGTVCVANITVGIEDESKFRDFEILGAMLETAIKAANLTKIGKAHVQPYATKDPKKAHGLTIIQCLKESHSALETYPEKMLVEILVSSCRDFKMAALKALMEPYSGWSTVVDTMFVRRENGQWKLSEE